MAVMDFIRYVMRNPSQVTKHARRANGVRKAMDKFREENPYCAWCGRDKKLEVHHIEPVSVAPEKAADFSNMIMLCRKPPCHQVIGHEGHFGGRYVENVKELCENQQAVKTVRYVEK